MGRRQVGGYATGRREEVRVRKAGWKGAQQMQRSVQINGSHDILTPQADGRQVTPPTATLHPPSL